MSRSVLIKHLEKEYQSVPEIIRSFEWLENYFFVQKDLRGIFTTAYLQITRSIAEAIKTGTFVNNSWTENYLICFANLYRKALLRYELDNSDFVPKSWQIAFDLAKHRQGLVIQHLLLGINAHINHDLAIALFEIKIMLERDQKYSDHTKVNLILEKATEDLKHGVAEKYAPILKRLDRGFGTIDG